MKSFESYIIDFLAVGGPLAIGAGVYIEVGLGWSLIVVGTIAFVGGVYMSQGVPDDSSTDQTQ